MDYFLSVPSKTFLLGEYVALKGGPTLILTTEPNFQLIATHNPDQRIENNQMHAESPAGKLRARDASFFQNYNLQFTDPYRTLGGFGASSAQFVMLYALKCLICESQINDAEMLKDYETLAWNGEGLAPSGADLIAQKHGGLCFFHKSIGKVQTYAWPFPELEYGLIHTGHKLATHSHLQQLTNLRTHDLEKIVIAGWESLQEHNSSCFIAAINHYASALQAQALVAKSTQEILKKLTAHPKILAAKGCGALGADVVLFLYASEQRDRLIGWLKPKWNLITFGHQVATGLKIVAHKKGG